MCSGRLCRPVTHSSPLDDRPSPVAPAGRCGNGVGDPPKQARTPKRVRRAAEKVRSSRSCAAEERRSDGKGDERCGTSRREEREGKAEHGRRARARGTFHPGHAFHRRTGSQPGDWMDRVNNHQAGPFNYHHRSRAGDSLAAVRGMKGTGWTMVPPVGPFRVFQNNRRDAGHSTPSAPGCP